MSYTEQLERETEQTRSRIADTLSELRACMTPGQVLDQLADRVGDAGGAAFVSNLKRQTIDNPVPVALIGAGLAWLMFGARPQSKARAFVKDSAERLGDAVGQGAQWTEVAGKKVEESLDAASSKAAEWSDKAGDLAKDAGAQVNSATERAKQSAADAGEALRQRAGSVSESVQRSASAGYEAVSDSARRTAATVAGTTRAAGQSALRTSNALVDFCREQPVLLAGLGLAIGAAIGAVLPKTETEDRLMGDASASLKERAQDLAATQYEAAETVAEEVFDAAKEAGKQAAQQEQTASAESETAATVRTVAPAAGRQ